MSKVRVAINGFGRIGRLVLRNLLSTNSFEVVAINDLAAIDTLAHLLQYDSVHGRLYDDVQLKDQQLLIKQHKIQVFQMADPGELPWKKLEVDLVIESTGRFTDYEGASKHMQAGASKVIISAPAKGDIRTIVLGVNEGTLSKEDQIVSNASCTTNCLAPMAKVLNENYGIEKGYISTIHAYTADQNLQDAPHKDLRRARAAALSIIPTSTGAAIAVGKVMPEMQGKLDGIAHRVPVPNGSLTDFTVLLKKQTSLAAVNDAFKKAAEGSLKGILKYSTDPIVSADIVGDPHSCIIDAPLTAVNENMVKVVAWYDNEYAYACRTTELAQKLSAL